MKPIPEEVVEKTWQEVAGFGPDRAKKEMIKVGNGQPELLAFVTESSEEMDKAVRELGIYMFLVVYRMLHLSISEVNGPRNHHLAVRD
jgi:hypothetical protein